MRVSKSSTSSLTSHPNFVIIIASLYNGQQIRHTCGGVMGCLLCAFSIEVYVRSFVAVFRHDGTLS